MVNTRRALPFVISIATVITMLMPAAPALPAGADCDPAQTPVFSGGLAALKDALGEPMGTPLECEHFNVVGDKLQRTTTGLAYYRPRTTTPAFTDGSTHWALTADGVVSWTVRSTDPPGAPPPAPLPTHVPRPTPLPTPPPPSERTIDMTTCDSAAGEVDGVIWAFDPQTQAPPRPYAGARLMIGLSGVIYDELNATTDGHYRLPIRESTSTAGHGSIRGDPVLFFEQGVVPGASLVFGISRQPTATGTACRLDLVATPPPPLEGTTPLPVCGPETVAHLMQPFVVLTQALGEEVTRTVDCAAVDPQSGATVQPTRGGMAFYQPWDDTLLFTDGWQRWRVDGGVLQQLPSTDQASAAVDP